MITFFEVKTNNQNLEIKTEENMNTGYDFKELHITFVDVSQNLKETLKKIASKYEARTTEPGKQDLRLILAIEPQDTAEEWVERIRKEIDQEDLRLILALGTTYKVEETDEAITTLQIVTAQDLNGTNFHRKQELTQQEKEDENLGQGIAHFLRINKELERDQQEVRINKQLINTAEKVRIHYPTITGNNSELIALIERTYTKTTPTEVAINNKPNNSGAIGHYYKTKQAIIEIATFEDILRKTSADFDDILERMNIYREPDFQEFYEKNWAHYPTITNQRNRTAQQFVDLANEAINEALAYTSNMTTYNMEDLHNHTIAHTYTDKMNPNTYIFIIIREYS